MITAIVTGASQGLGKEIARLLADHGFAVLAPTRKDMDVGNPDSINKFCSLVHRVDVLVNNAAILGETLEEALRVNAMGAYHLTSALWPKLVDNQGQVINISSREGLMWGDTFGRRHYSVSKTTLNAVTRMMADNKDAVTVNACCPGWFRSRLGGKHAPQSATEAADTPVWLATQASLKYNGKFFINREVVPW